MVCEELHSNGKRQVRDLDKPDAWLDFAPASTLALDGVSSAGPRAVVLREDLGLAVGPSCRVLRQALWGQVGPAADNLCAVYVSLFK